MSHLRHAGTTAETPGQRLYLIRLGLGDGVKNALRIDPEFVELVERLTGFRYDPSAISRAENGSRKLSLDDVARFAAVDPLRRGRDWLGWGSGMAEPIAENVPLIPAAVEAVRRARASAPAESPPSKRKAVGGRPHPARRPKRK